MASGIEFPAGKRAEILALLGQGKTMREIDEATGVAWQTIYGWRSKDDQFRADIDTARETYSRYRVELAKERKHWLDDKLFEIAGIEGDQRQMDAIKTLHKAMSEQVQRFELTGADGGPLEVLNPDVAAAIDRFTALASRAVREADSEGTRELPPVTD